MKSRLLFLSLVIFCSLPAYAEYTYQLVVPPGASNANLFGINEAGKTVGGAFDDDFNFLYSFEFDMKKGEYTILGEEFDAIGISNNGVIVGSGGEFLDICAIREKNGDLMFFYPPSYTPDSFCQARGVNPNGKVSGFVLDEFGVWTGFIFDSEYGTFEEFLPSPQTIAQGINAQGQNAGSVFLFPDEAYDGSPPGRYAYLRKADGTFKYFEIGQSLPGESRARGISENGLVDGFFLNSDTFEYTGYITSLSKGDDFEYLVLGEDEVLHLRPCSPDLPAPPDGYVILTDVFIAGVRNDGVAVGQCADYHFNPDTFDFIPFGNYGLIATPIK